MAKRYKLIGISCTPAEYEVIRSKAYETKMSMSKLVLLAFQDKYNLPDKVITEPGPDNVV